MASIWASAIASKPRARPSPAPGRALLLGLLLGLAALPAAAEQVYLPPERFVAEAFAGAPPQPQVLWLSGSLRDEVSQILGHPPSALRTRYWRQGTRSAWVLEEVGKEAPITAGFIVDGDAVQQVRVLIYRESRGWEVRHEFFTRQFNGARLTPERELDTRIDNISGATLSVNALRRLGRLALHLHAHVSTHGPT